MLIDENFLKTFYNIYNEKSDYYYKQGIKSFDDFIKKAVVNDLAIKELKKSNKRIKRLETNNYITYEVLEQFVTSWAKLEYPKKSDKFHKSITKDLTDMMKSSDKKSLD